MSYALRLAAEAHPGLRRMEPWLQEEALDEAERLADDPGRLVQRGSLPGYVHDFTRDRGGVLYYVFLLERDDSHQVLTVKDIGLVMKGGSSASLV